MPKSIRILGLLISLVVLRFAVSAQAPKQATPPKTEKTEQMIDDAHRGILQPKTNSAVEAGKLTNKVMTGTTGKSGAPIARKNFIDEQIFGRMDKDRIPHAQLSTDEEFLRRVYMDATGQLPSADTVRQFLANPNPRKRDDVVDTLVSSDEFAEQWGWLWGDLFRVLARSGDGNQGHVFHYWNKEWLHADRPYNEVVHDLMVASAKSHSAIPATNLIGRNSYDTNVLPSSADDFSVGNRLDAIDDFNIDTGRIFLGLNLTCISCHDGAGHLESINEYLAGKTRQEFFRQSAFMGNVRTLVEWSDRSKNTGNSDQVIDDLAKGYNTGSDAPWMTTSLNRMPRDGKTYEPAFILTGEKPKAGENPREAFARMLTNHVQFSRATMNWIWGRLMTVAFVEPYDGFDLARWQKQATNPELLEALAREFRTHNYSVQYMVKSILKSNAYGLSSRFDGEWKDAYAPYYARKYVRVLSGTEVVDAIMQVTGRPGNYVIDGVRVSRLKQLATPMNVGKNGENGEVGSMMEAFFQSNRATQVPDGNRPTTLQALLMTGSGVVNNRVLAEKGGRLERLLAGGKPDGEIIEDIFLTTLGRRPNAAEKELALQAFERNRKEGAEDLQWTLMNAIEFILNH
jgi:uncharacterized protein DUF1549/uncharacterized protein DUF1553